MDSFGSLDNFWDISQHPSSFPTLAEDDFLALLQKQFPTSNLFELNPADGIDPINISSLPLPNPTPPSTDSSPSPPSVNQEPTLSRRQSGVFSSGVHRSLEEDSSLKRKASSESIDDEPMHKNAHTDAATKKPASGPARRKSTGDPRQDETRLMKRKEQNRAAQRAFRERKEKHVKDLEDKVAALEAKNQQAESENGNLRDLLSRLQSENMALKQAAFTFSVPKPNGLAPSAFQHQQVPAFYPTPGASTSTGASASIPQSQPSFGVDFASLIPFDPASLNQLDEPADTPMNLDYPTNGMSPYKTIASNPMYMSFAEPTPYDLSPPPFMQGQSPPSDPQSTQMDTTHLTPFSWSSPASVGSPPSTDLDSLDHLFGGLNGAQSPVDFSALLRSSPSSVSPVSHTGLRPNSASSSASPASSHSLSASSPLSNPSSSTSYQSPLANGECPRTREECVKAIAQAGASPFVQEPNPAPRQPQLPVSSFTPLASATSATGENCGRMTTEALMAQINNQAEDSVGPNGGFVRKMSDGNGSVVMCKGSSFPKTEKNERNVEVLAAWRSIMQNPQFKNVDINELCSEFTKKARCDGTKVVLEPESVSDIIETLAVKRS